MDFICANNLRPIIDDDVITNCTKCFVAKALRV